MRLYGSEVKVKFRICKKLIVIPTALAVNYPNGIKYEVHICNMMVQYEFVPLWRSWEGAIFTSIALELTLGV